MSNKQLAEYIKERIKWVTVIETPYGANQLWRGTEMKGWHFYVSSEQTEKCFWITDWAKRTWKHNLALVEFLAHIEMLANKQSYLRRGL